MYEYIIYHISYLLKCIDYINNICQITYITLIVYSMYYILNFYILEGILQHILESDSTREESTRIQPNVQTGGAESYFSNISFKWQML